MNSSSLSVDLEVLVFCGQNVLMFFFVRFARFYMTVVYTRPERYESVRPVWVFFSRNVLVANLLCILPKTSIALVVISFMFMFFLLF